MVQGGLSFFMQLIINLEGKIAHLFPRTIRFYIE